MSRVWLVLFVAGSLWASEQASFAIIVNLKNGTEDLSPTELERIYGGRQDRWDDGQKIVAINRPVGADIRRDFYELVFRAAPTLKFFKPNSPIPFNTMVVQSDAAVARFVAHIPNAIGYVSASFESDAVRVLKVEH